jgi:hypothetical protein
MAFQLVLQIKTAAFVSATEKANEALHLTAVQAREYG